MKKYYMLYLLILVLIGSIVFFNVDTYKYAEPEVIDRPVNLENEIEIKGRKRYLISGIENVIYKDNKVIFEYNNIKCEFFVGKRTRHLVEHEGEYTIYSLNVGNESINLLYLGPEDEALEQLLGTVKINKNEWAEYKTVAFRYELLTYYSKDYLSVNNVDIIPYEESEMTTIDDTVKYNEVIFRFSTAAETDGYRGYHYGDLLFITNLPKNLEVFYAKNN